MKGIKLDPSFGWFIGVGFIVDFHRHRCCKDLEIMVGVLLPFLAIEITFVPKEHVYLDDLK